MRLADAAPAPIKFRPAPITLVPPPVVGHYLAGSEINATVFPSQVLSSLGTNQQPKRNGFIGTDGSWCVAEAASVVETGKFLEDTDGHSSKRSQQCADFVLRLRYLVVVKTHIFRGGEGATSDFDGTVTVVDLDTQKIVSAFPVDTHQRGGLSPTLSDKYGRQYALVLEGAGDPTVAAEALIDTELAARLPGAKVVPKGYD